LFVFHDQEFNSMIHLKFKFRFDLFFFLRTLSSHFTQVQKKVDGLWPTCHSAESSFCKIP